MDGEGSLDFKGTVPEGIVKTRLDAWLAGQLPLVSRARVQSNIRQGLILVNGKVITKVCRSAPASPSGVLGLSHVTVSVLSVG